MTEDTIIIRNAKGQERKVRPSNTKAPMRLAQKSFHVAIDYVESPTDQFLETTECATLKVGEINIGEQLVLKGLADVIKRGPPSYYDQLLVAAAKAKRARYVANGSRFKLIIPKEDCKMTFVLEDRRAPGPTNRGAWSSAGGYPVSESKYNQRMDKIVGLEVVGFFTLDKLNQTLKQVDIQQHCCLKFSDKAIEQVAVVLLIQGWTEKNDLSNLLRVLQTICHKLLYNPDSRLANLLLLLHVSKKSID
ncbi:hypothetical protein BGZ95_006888 [Linnemannia exigua]|uniref:Uncharacterized protein n=1 Tax=Linnemannia exigua TaxID=604196 RepID=A0AAD4DHT6_9FUNG|nr:hypothetical protein BGZ95_006888 [Linnemannia exigua]